MHKWQAADFWFELTQGPSPDGIGFARYNEVTCRKCGTKAKHLACGQSVDQLRKFFIRQNWQIGRTRLHHVCPECAHKHKHSPAREPQPEPLPSNVVQLRPGVPARGALQHAWESATKEERAEFLLALETSEGVILARPQAAPVPKPEPSMTMLYRIIEPGLTHFDYNEIITTSELLAAQQKYGSDSFKIKAVELQKTLDDFLNEVKQRTAPKPLSDFLLSDLLHKPTPKPLSEWQHGSNIDSMPIEAALPPIEHPPVEAIPPIEHPPVEAIPPSEPPPNDDDDDDAADWWKELQTK